ncbi:MAG: XisI protein [Okeania sp. SIO2D1]|nr:XisI protein [Okeania sp. SIO2D1]
METLTTYQDIISKILNEYFQIPYSYGDLQRKLIVSRDEKNYLLLTLGWQNDKRVHGCLIHLEIVDDKIWIHRDGTEDGIANELLAAGIPKEKIVLGFHHPQVRQHTAFAVN